MNPKKSIALLTLIASLGMILPQAHSATFIDFTSGEGYSNTYLYSQPSSGATWSTGGGSYLVNTGSGGSVTADASIGNYTTAPARYGQAFSSVAGQTLTASLDFTFVGVNVTSAPASSGDRQYVSSLNFGPTSTGIYDGVIGGTLSTLEFAPAGTYSFQLFSSQYVSFSYTDLGLTAGGGTTSNNLRLSLTTTAASSGNSSYTVDLVNLNTSSTVFSVSGSADISAYSSLYAAFGGGGATTDASSMTATSLTLASVPEPSTYALVLGGVILLLMLKRNRRVS